MVSTTDPTMLLRLVSRLLTWVVAAILLLVGSI